MLHSVAKLLIIMDIVIHLWLTTAPHSAGLVMILLRLLKYSITISISY